MRKALTKKQQMKKKNDKSRRSSQKKPNLMEKQLQRFLDRIVPNEYKYVGDGEFMLGIRSPDYVNINGKKKVIELFGEYWHSKAIKGSGKDEHIIERLKYFKDYGFDCLIIWENDLRNTKELKQKVINFTYV